MEKSEVKRKQLLLHLIEKAVTEMEQNESMLLGRGDILREEYRPLYHSKCEELKDVYEYLHAGGTIKNAYRYLQLNVFMRHETFFMDLFETRHFPILFELFEFE